MSPLPVLLGSFAKLRKVIISFVYCVSAHGTARLSLAGFFVKCLWGLFEKNYRRNLIWIDMW